MIKELKPQRVTSGLHFSEKLIETFQNNIALNITNVNQNLSILFHIGQNWSDNSLTCISWKCNVVRSNIVNMIKL